MAAGISLPWGVAIDEDWIRIVVWRHRAILGLVDVKHGLTPGTAQGTVLEKERLAIEALDPEWVRFRMAVLLLIGPVIRGLGHGVTGGIASKNFRSDSFQWCFSPSQDEK